ncbi:Archaemetzincin-2 [Lachnellula hyalina]|uniref:Archaemetzincin-2 n=1 Tax=Lachnellula hyalina TaxID=1316788 RepID=A0A8H8R1K6_9HELO|nr:Archaemetzincin-2 [Lachnellula hyalina]TVY25986.1 Archaemetzincin-2 [Lachnellula hyalina]
MSRKSSSRCSHENLTFTSSSNAVVAGYKRQTLLQRTAAASTQVIKANSSSAKEAKPSTFPAPLVLPEDELSWDPTDPPQSLRSWSGEQHRNKITPERRTVYLAAPPSFSPEVSFAQKWSQPKGARARSKSGEQVKVEVQDVLEYLQAFYHGLPVKLLPSPNPIFTNDVDDMEVDLPPKTAKGKPERQTLWLNTHTPVGCVGIRSRPMPKGEFSHQLNLNDLLDAAIEILPKDAYAFLMLVEHDIYEDEEDDFVCGRAYGGSRIAVISTARYNPALDMKQNIEREHGWPASHCERYIKWCVDGLEEVGGDKKRKREEGESSGENVMSPMQAALAAHNSLPSLAQGRPSPAALSALWLARACRTAAHELGHCFGIGHCVYYACSMQGTASIIEDARQPLYLCPIDLAKVLNATGANLKERYQALLAFCEGKNEGQVFKAHGAWIKARLDEIMREESN